MGPESVVGRPELPPFLLPIWLSLNVTASMSCANYDDWERCTWNRFHLLRLSRIQKFSKTSCVAHAVVGIVVVHDRVDLLGRALHLFNARHPLLQVGVRVVVAKANVWRRVAQVPVLVIAAVAARTSKLGRRHLM